MRRGEIWWASLGPPGGSAPGLRRPVVVVQSDEFNRSRIATVICATVTSNTHLGLAPGNFVVQGRSTGLSRPSVVNVSQLVTLSRSVLRERLGRIPPARLDELDSGLRLVLAV